MKLFNLNLLSFLHLILLIYKVECSFSEYLENISGYLGFKKERNSNEYVEDEPPRIPYEVSTTDERFISEASKLTGVALSELDSCQHRVVLKLQSDCDKMNDEQLAKMAVHLLNCLSYIEGRRIYPCTDEMTIKQCTMDMDSDTWTSYHLMSNRARAVCYTIRQVQFRGLAEHTVNKLMAAARDQLGTLKQIATDQREIKDIAETTHDTLYKGQNLLFDQQKNLQKAQFHGQLTLEDNIRKLIDEKKLISESHGDLIRMTQALQQKLEESTKQIEYQTDSSKVNHEELIKDLINIQERANVIFHKIEESSELIMKQNKDLKLQYQSTLKNLDEVNKTVHSLVNLVGGTRNALEERLAWVSTALGGTDLAIERIYLILWHVGFMLVAMISSAFLTARFSTRLIVATLPPLNLVMALYGEHGHFDIIKLAAAMAAFIISQMLFLSTIKFYREPPKAFLRIKDKLTPTKPNISKRQSSQRSTPNNITPIDEEDERDSIHESTYYEFTNNHSEYIPDKEFYTERVTAPTPPLSRIGFYSPRSRSNTPNSRLNGRLNSCSAKTRAGTPCKLSSLPGRDFCHRHQTGDSVLG